MTVFFCFFVGGVGALLICRMHSNFQDSHWAIHKNHERYQVLRLLFVLSTYVVAKKEAKTKDIYLFSSFGNTVENDSYYQSFKFSEKHREN